MTTKTCSQPALPCCHLPLRPRPTTYTGNGNSGFGGAIGGGSLTLTDDGTTLFGTVTRARAASITPWSWYIDLSAAAFSDTSVSLTPMTVFASPFQVLMAATEHLNLPPDFCPITDRPQADQLENFGGLWSLPTAATTAWVSFPVSALRHDDRHRCDLHLWLEPRLLGITADKF